MTAVTDRIAALEDEINSLHRRLADAQDELLRERFADTPPKYKEGDIVLVPRLLFGKRKMWPAQIRDVHFHYNSGTDAWGDDWESKNISYTYFLQQKDGTFGGSSDSAFEDSIKPVTAESETHS